MEQKTLNMNMNMSMSIASQSVVDTGSKEITAEQVSCRHHHDHQCCLSDPVWLILSY